MLLPLLGLQLRQRHRSSIMMQRFRLAILGGLVLLGLAGCGSTGGTESIKVDATDGRSAPATTLLLVTTTPLALIRKPEPKPMRDEDEKE